MSKDKTDWEKPMTTTFQLRIDSNFLKLLDDWRRQQDDLPSRSEAVRRLVEAAAGADKDRKKKARPVG
jgi:hypothetical protein